MSVTGTKTANLINKKLSFKNNAPLRSRLPNINSTFIDNEEDLDIFMPMYNLFECNDKYFMASSSVQNYFRDDVNDAYNKDNNNYYYYKANNNKTRTSGFFKYKTKTIGSTPDNDTRLDTKFVALMKHLSSFQRSFDVLLINCKIQLYVHAQNVV